MNAMSSPSPIDPPLEVFLVRDYFKVVYIGARLSESRPSGATTSMVANEQGVSKNNAFAA